jgi:Uma2 family endonuclease
MRISAPTPTAPTSSLALSVRSLGLSDDQFHQLCRDNEDYRFELSSSGDLIIMAPTSPRTDLKNAKITARLVEWAERNGTGIAFGSSAMFTLPDGAKRSPDGAWIDQGRWDALSEEEKDGITPACPDFVLELRSLTDRLEDLDAKMHEYISNGARLAWLLDPIEDQAIVYRPGQTPERITSLIDGGPVLPGFRFDFGQIR